MRRGKQISALVLAAGLLVSGCASGGNTDTTAAPASETTKAVDEAASTNASTTAAAASETTGEPVTLRFSWWGADDRHEKTLEVIEMYEAAHPNITIEAEYRGQSEREKVATELGSGTGPDIVQLNPPWMGDFTANGDFFVNLLDYQDKFDLSGFNEKLLQEYCYNGEQLITLPSGVNARNYIVNKTKLEALGIQADMTIEWTWDNLIEIGKTVHAANPDQYFLNADKVDLTEFVLRPYIIQKTGKQLISDDFELGFTDAELKEALTYIAALYTEGVVLPASEGNTFLNSVWTNPDWINGDLMTELSWTSLITGVTGDMVDEYGITTLPAHQDAVDSAVVVKPSQLFAITKSSEHPTEAADFLSFFLTNVDAGLVLSDCRGIPPYQAVQDACMEAGILEKNVIDATQYAQDNSGLYENTASTNAEITTVLNDAVEMVSYDPAQVDTAVSQTMALIEDILSTLK